MVCTVLYVGVAIVLLGMMKYTNFISGPAADAPVAYALRTLGARPLFQAVIVIGALMGMISSLLVFQYGQARIWYAMSRDGLLPKLFSAVHPKFKTPHWSTWIACFAVGIPAGLVDIGDAADLSNIGTLFAFVLVSLGVIFLRKRQPERPRSFQFHGPAVPPDFSRTVRRVDDRPDGHYVVALRYLAGDRAGDLLHVQQEAQRVCGQALCLMVLTEPRSALLFAVPRSFRRLGNGFRGQ